MTAKIQFWREGASARVRGLPADHCPYKSKGASSVARREWLQGWEDADKFEFLIQFVGPVEAPSASAPQALP